MIIIKSLTFEKSAKLERLLKKHDITFDWVFSGDCQGCIDRLYDLSITESTITESEIIELSYIANMVRIRIGSGLDKEELLIPTHYFSELTII